VVIGRRFYGRSLHPASRCRRSQNAAVRSGRPREHLIGPRRPAKGHFCLPRDYLSPLDRGAYIGEQRALARRRVDQRAASPSAARALTSGSGAASALVLIFQGLTLLISAPRADAVGDICDVRSGAHLHNAHAIGCAPIAGTQVGVSAEESFLRARVVLPWRPVPTPSIPTSGTRLLDRCVGIVRQVYFAAFFQANPRSCASTSI
jgi:hypothetical protein